MKHRAKTLGAIIASGIGVCARSGLGVGAGMGLGVGALLPAQAAAAGYPSLDTQVGVASREPLQASRGSPLLPHWPCRA